MFSQAQGYMETITMLQIILTTLLIAGSFADYDSAGYDGDYGSAGDYYDDHPTSNENEAVNRLQEHNEALIKLFGSYEVVSSAVYDKLFTSPTAMDFAKAKLHIQQAMENSDKYSVLSSSQKSGIQDTIEILDESIDERAELEIKPLLTKALIAEAPTLTQLLPIDVVFNHLEEFNTFGNANQWKCYRGYLENLWKKIVDASQAKSKNIQQDLYNAIVSVLKLQEILSNAANKGNSLKPSEEKLKLLYMFSQDSYRAFARKIIGVQRFEDIIQDVICSQQLDLETISTIMRQFTLTTTVTDPTEMKILVDMQASFTEVIGAVACRSREVMKSVAATRSGTDWSRIGGEILESYLKLVDNAVNVSKSEIWAQMPLEEVADKLHHMLLSNEQYVGSVSEVILYDDMSDGSNYTLEKDSLSVSISKVHLDDNTTAQFQYNDTVITTDGMSSLNKSEGEDLRVYTLRYKSWSEMIARILETHFNLEKGNLSETEGNMRRRRSVDNLVSSNDTVSNKSFVGKGGVVSLSTRQSGVKRSVPVTYWIGFDSDNSDLTHRCLSCEYLDAETVSWQTSGCQVINVDAKGITCKCNHTTNFAAFMMPAEMMFDLTQQEAKVLDILSLAGSFLSIIGLLFSLMVFFYVRNLVRNERLRAHVHLTIALLVVHVIFISSEVSLKNDIACVISTLFAHYFLMATFMWMLIEGIFLYLYVVQVFLRSKIVNYNWMYIVGWVVPVAFVAVSAGYGIPLDIYVMPAEQDPIATEPQCPNGTTLYSFVTESEGPKYGRCWLSTKSGIIWSFLVPAVLVLLFNAVIMGKTMKICLKSLRNSDKMKSRNKVYRPGGKYYTPTPSTDKHSESNPHTDTFEHLHSQSTDKTQSDSAPVVSGSPCLLQVTTDEEQKELKNCDSSSVELLKDDDAKEVSENAADTRAEEKEDYAPPSRYHSVSGEPTRVTGNNRPSLMYRNSLTHNNSPKLSAKPRSIGSGMARLTSERSRFFREAKASVKGMIVLLPILGVPWIFGLFAHLHQAFTFLFVVINSIQGLAIFFVYCVFNGEIRRAIQRRLAMRNTKHSVHAGMRRTSSTSTTRSFLGWGRRRSTLTSST